MDAADTATDDPIDQAEGGRRGAPLAQFVVLADGSLRGDDGAGGAVAAALPYLGRLAARVGELVGAGEPVALETVADARLSVQLSWNQAGEGTFRAVVTPVEARAAMQFAVVGGGDVDAALAHCVQRVCSLPGARWSAVLSSDTRVVAASGHHAADLERLPEIGTRVLGVLRSRDQDGTDVWARLDYDGVSVMGATVGRHCLFALVDRVEEEAAAPVVAEVRAVLGTHDLAAASRLVSAAPVAQVSESPEPPSEGVVTAAPPAPVGARYRRPAASEHRQSSALRRLRGR